MALESIPEDRLMLISIGRHVRNQMTQDSFISSAQVHMHLRLNQDMDTVTQHPVRLGELQHSNNNPDEHYHKGPPCKQHTSSRGGLLPPSQSGKPYPSNGSVKRNKDNVEEDNTAYDKDYHTCHEGILEKPTEVVGDHCDEQADNSGLQDTDLKSQILAVVLEENWNASDSDDALWSWRRSGAHGRSRRAATLMQRLTHIYSSNGILNKVWRERGEEKENKICKKRDSNEVNGMAGVEEEDEDEQDEEYKEDKEDEEDNDDGQNNKSNEEGRY
ncbi:hypothetical protein BDZ91DRAFT_803951 [Kalaharituber pfeilii]|nr:hypothetical protein BDZ91DRAFT_803951 [Kalaharituber pfeilii]